MVCVFLAVLVCAAALASGASLGASTRPDARAATLTITRVEFRLRSSPPLLRISGVSSDRAFVTATLSRGRATVASGSPEQSFEPGPFEFTIRLPSPYQTSLGTYTPLRRGTYVLRLEGDTPVGPVAAEAQAVLAAPPVGIVNDATVFLNRRSVERVRDDVFRRQRAVSMEAWFVFAVQPLPGRTIRVTWHSPRKRLGSVTKRNRPVITSKFVWPTVGVVPLLRPGIWRAVLTVAGTRVAEARVLVIKTRRR